MSDTPVRQEFCLLAGLGTSKPVSTVFDDSYDTVKLKPMNREQWFRQNATGAIQRLRRLRKVGERGRRDCAGSFKRL
ncbi:uncharacterized protein Z519_09452 [Cladophialophora bantiana CBS 173.52]|uniref:Uncharacterized protein n=1 Tax=Cladophialophora bantiana (strain ATCC 10958 / CBS 173.52 / CDC B-1940 / NIH 8579) TaxID=1442370 RepID=A0A0D2FU19_CLAB1|nr:uncharacterized protein Z519_09452 [Cladophialophora bantiana CBS 173.52]KIW90022.1 hypothetical protein Z519_09452 [Cladophialophora bantiana CBS 173.52]